MRSVDGAFDLLLVRHNNAHAHDRRKMIGVVQSLSAASDGQRSAMIGLDPLR